MPKNSLGSMLIRCRGHYLLMVVLCLAFLIRWSGIYFDYPGVNFISDEVHNISFILKVAEAKSLNVNVSVYPALLSFLYFPVVILKIGYTALAEGLLGVDALKAYFLPGMGRLYVIGRWYSVFFGTATVFLIYKTHRLLFKNYASALSASAVWAFSLVPVYLSHWGKVHSALVFFVMLALYFALRFEKTKNVRSFYLSVLAASAAFSVHYAGIAVAVFPALGFVMNRRALKINSGVMAAAVYGLMALFFYLINFTGVKEMVRSTLIDYYGANEYSLYSVGAAERFYYVFRDAFRLEPVWVLLFGIIFCFNFRSFFKDRRRRYILAGLAASYLLMISFVTAPGISRHLATFLALTIPFAAGFTVEWLLARHVHSRLVFAVAILLIVPSAIVSLKWVSLLKAHTRLEAKTWLVSQVKKDEIVYSFDNYLDAPLSYNAARWHQQTNQVYDSAKINYIIANEEKFLHSGVNLFYDLYEERYEHLGGERTKYIVLSYWQTAEGEKLVNTLARYHEIRLVGSFYPTADTDLAQRGIVDYINNPIDWKTLFQLKKAGPFVEIYEIVHI